jgi:predicted Fe-Mo cluster-binding NifX family protein
MKVCIPCAEPGGPDSAIESAFEETDILDYYEVDEDGRFVHTAHMRNCGGAACIDPVDAIVGRGVDVVIVTDITPANLMRFKNAAVRVLVSDNPSVRSTLDEFTQAKLRELTLEDLKDRGAKK